MKKLLLFASFAVLAACSDTEKAEPLPQQTDTVDQAANETGVATNTSPTLPTEEQLTEEPIGIQAETLIENAPTMPTNFEEIMAYPVGPFSGNSYYAQLEGKNTMTSEQLADTR